MWQVHNSTMERRDCVVHDGAGTSRRFNVQCRSLASLRAVEPLIPDKRNSATLVESEFQLLSHGGDRHPRGLERRDAAAIRQLQLAASVTWAPIFFHFLRLRFCSTEFPICAAPLAEGYLTKSLEGVQVCDPTGARVSLTSLWENRKAVVAFGRHFGCMLCRKRAGLLEARKTEMDAAGVALVLIAPGVPEQAKGFLEHNKFTGEVYADPEYAAYEALDFTKGFLSVVNPKSGQRLIQARLDGYDQDWELSLGYKDTVQKGSWLQGGILVAGPGKDTVHYFFKVFIFMFWGRRSRGRTQHGGTDGRMLQQLNRPRTSCSGSDYPLESKVWVPREKVVGNRIPDLCPASGELVELCVIRRITKHKSRVAV
ncbi:hypothetical protein AXG93_960s1180 [Marchantia polymorpha subsp. ruderalis]|uniref:Thioredoxin domain-containing protein n=1 Tax=Marchantia polymorpha subsp. ruderalis TaxID=1480154 RepID=A0A176VGI6_MARPO|nr:hypothetical protein AXG93_960s1180 [Marchantia polymorpha subsp. ruderalis]